MTSTLISGARLVSGGTIADDAWVLLDGARVAEVGQGTPPADLVADSRVDAHGAWLTPGFVDIHCHGGGGASFDDGEQAIQTALATHRAHGTTRHVLSLVTASIDRLAERLGAVVAVADRDPLVLGAHLEGPFLDVGHKGAHDPELLRDPAADAVGRLLEAGHGHIVQVTIAPELPGAEAAIERFVAAGVVVAVGHTDADYEQTKHAFEAGATIVTHAFNAMNGIHHRAPGPIAAATGTPGVMLELICDGVHVHPEVMRMLFAAAPGRIALVTDAMAAAGSADGDYILGSLAVEVRDGIARLAGGGSIAGSTLTLDAALRRAVTEVGVPVEAAVAALTETPAAAIGRGAEFGRLAPGFAADAVLLDDDFTVTHVWAAGDRVR
jgi:N-acetylglucosamine-6-phosphate deacetylase